LTTLATNRTRRVLAVAVGLFLLAAVFGAPVTGMLDSSGRDFQDPASQYERANTAITHATGQDSFYEVIALLRGPTRIGAHAASGRAVETVAALLGAQRGFRSPPTGMIARSSPLLSRDRRETVVTATYADATDATDAVAHVRASLSTPGTKAKLAGMSARFGGYALLNKELNERTTSDLARAELVGLPLLLLLSFWFFRGLVAALLPILVGGLAILLTFLALRVIDRFVPVSVFSLNLVSGMGLGLGIDYSLFVLYRYREELAAGLDTHSAIECTLATVGRTVLFSSLTVAAAMTSLLVFPLRFLYSMCIGGTVVVVCDGAVALLLLPAVLVALGPRINALSPRWLQRRAARSARATEDGGWWRLAHGVVRRPAPVAVISGVVLLAAAIPAFHLTFTSPGANMLPANAPSHEVEAALAKDFPANPGEQTEIVLAGSSSTARALASEEAGVAGALASVSAPRHVGSGAWAIALAPHGSPYSGVQQRLLARLRAHARSLGALVGGATAYFADQRSAVASHIPLALLILFPLTAGFLFLMTGSVLIPIKALVMNALSVSVAVGLQVLIFQDGHLSGPLGFTPIGGLEESSLVLMLVLAFALATDYEVFVLARIKEAHDRGLPNREAIALGIERTGRIVTAAALLFCVAIGVLSTSELFFTKQLGLGAALAVAIDASIVRALLVPSLMALMGKWNWWAPRWLKRLHARVGLDERALAEA
jgi:RND superfamily putative drug exporter